MSKRKFTLKHHGSLPTNNTKIHVECNVIKQHVNELPFNSELFINLLERKSKPPLVSFCSLTTG